MWFVRLVLSRRVSLIYEHVRARRYICSQIHTGVQQSLSHRTPLIISVTTTDDTHYLSLLPAFLLVIASGFGITAGAHRLWSHKAYKAKWPLSLILMFLFTITGQVNTIKLIKERVLSSTQTLFKRALIKCLHFMIIALTIALVSLNRCLQLIICVWPNLLLSAALMYRTNITILTRDRDTIKQAYIQQENGLKKG